MTFFMAPSFCCPNAIDPEMSVGGDDYAAEFLAMIPRIAFMRDGATLPEPPAARRPAGRSVPWIRARSG